MLWTFEKQPRAGCPPAPRGAMPINHPSTPIHTRPPPHHPTPPQHSHNRHHHRIAPHRTPHTLRATTPTIAYTYPQHLATTQQPPRPPTRHALYLNQPQAHASPAPAPCATAATPDCPRRHTATATAATNATIHTAATPSQPHAHPNHQTTHRPPPTAHHAHHAHHATSAMATRYKLCDLTNMVNRAVWWKRAEGAARGGRSGW